MPLFIPEDYTAKLAPETMEQAITYLKEIFPDMLARRLRLRRVTAPLFVLSGTGINDDLNGVERAVSFPIRDLGDRRAEVVHSLAKWKRMKLGTYKIAPGYGLYTDMNAIRADEELDNIHSQAGVRGPRRQLAICGCPERREMEFHRLLLEGRLPLSIGGGIGQSRLCMFYLRCAHIGEVQVSIWPERMIAECAAHGIYLK